jgi:hypothetical protein
LVNNRPRKQLCSDVIIAPNIVTILVHVSLLYDVNIMTKLPNDPFLKPYPVIKPCMIELYHVEITSFLFIKKIPLRQWKDVEITIKRGLGRMEKDRGESIRVIIHIYIEMSQGNSLYSYLKQTKMSFLQNQRTGEQNRSCLGGWYQCKRGGYGERV